MLSLKSSDEIAYNGSNNCARMDLFADTAADLTGVTTFDSIVLLAGSSALDISTGDLYRMQSDGTWVLQPGTGAFHNVYTKAEIDAMIANYYTKSESDDLYEWITVTITTDDLPLTFKADGTPLISWSMKGNGSQTGTPAPDNPIIPEFVGVRTGNLCSAEIEQGTFNPANGQEGANERRVRTKFDNKPLQSGTYTINCVGATGGVVLYSYDTADVSSYDSASSKTAWSTLPFTFTLSAAKFVRFAFCKSNAGNIVPSEISNLMLNLGSTALPYEPFGWAEKITCAGQTTPIYLGEVQTVRRIKKLVLTGEEEIRLETAETNRTVYYLFVNNCLGNFGFCTHIEWKSTYQPTEYDRVVYVQDGRLFISLSNAYLSAQTVQAFKDFLAAQYAAGTPVTIWYVLATEQTGIANEPLAKIGDYADELSSEDASTTIPTVRGQNTLTIGTTLQPSEITITGKIRET